MKLKSKTLIIWLLFIGYFGLRLLFSLQTEYFNNEYSYFALRQIENIANTGRPIIHDELSYGGRIFVFMPFYFYILAMFTKILPGTLIIKIINNFFASTIIISVYLVCSKITQNRKISILASLVSSAIPIYIKETLNNISPYSVFFPATIFFAYYFMNLRNNQKMLDYLIPLSLIIVLSSPAAFLLILGFVIYLIFGNIENIPIERIELELVSFFTFFFLWANFIIFKLAFQKHGFSVIWKNVPYLVDTYMNNLNFLTIAASVGFLPLVFGTYTLYSYIVKKKSKNISLIVSLFLASFIVFWFRLIHLELALMFFGTLLVILFSQFLKDFFALLKKTKFSGYSSILYASVVVLLMVSQIIPGFMLMYNSVQESPSKDYIAGFSWLRENTPEDSTIVALPEEGNLITYFGNRKNVADSDYLMIDNPEVVLKDIELIFRQRFKVGAIQLLEKYNAEYILFSEKTKKTYKLDHLMYVPDPCFELVFDSYIQIYHWKKDECGVRTL
ncbi:hypothetical protein JXC34_07180 [Candidatus Woesearchaeota archaeon]|nr:hypothetical protein [Candidatus Woesearchaeota archaeon]